MKKIIRLLIILLLVISATVFLNINNTSKAAEMEISETSKTIKLNNKAFLSIKNNTTGSKVNWSSSNESVATVDSNGDVTGVGIGKATIKAEIETTSLTCEITVEYGYLDIKEGDLSAIEQKLVLGLYPSKKFNAVAQDGKSVVVENALVTWKSSNESVAKVDSSGKVTAVAKGTATITASVEGASDTLKVTVLAEPEYTDFSKAKCELLFDTDTDLKILNITPNDNSYYYGFITSEKKEPDVPENISDALQNNDALILSTNKNDKYIYRRNVDKYVELNKDMYLWVLEDVKLGDGFTNDDNKYISRDRKFVLKGEKLTKPSLPQLNLIVKAFNISKWNSTTSSEENKSTWISFRFPSYTEKRKFTLKIGKVTDGNILNKIHNNDYSGITELLSYAKSHSAVYTKELETTSSNYFSSKDVLFDGNTLLTHKDFYYIYVLFDDENGKYAPVEGVTLGQAWIGTSLWDLYAYTSENIEWNNLSGDYTVATRPIPQTGEKIIIITSIVIIGIGTVVLINRYKRIVTK